MSRPVDVTKRPAWVEALAVGVVASAIWEGVKVVVPQLADVSLSMPWYLTLVVACSAAWGTYSTATGTFIPFMHPAWDLWPPILTFGVTFIATLLLEAIGAVTTTRLGTEPLEGLGLAAFAAISAGGGAALGVQLARLSWRSSDSTRKD